jgi:O-antigen/teichoic acid export membrane protein
MAAANDLSVAAEPSMRRLGRKSSASAGVHVVDDGLAVAVSADGAVMAPVVTRGGPKLSLRRAGLLVAGAMAVGNGLNYGYHAVMSRILGPSSYGALGALLAITFLVSLPGVALQAVVARHTAIRVHRSEPLHELWGSVMRTIVFAAAGLFILVALASPALKPYLHVSSWLPMLWLAIGLLPMAVIPAVAGMLQGEERWVAFSAAQLSSIVVKFGAGIALVEMGFGVSGALAGAAIGSFCGLVLGVWLARPGWGSARMSWPLIREVAVNGVGLLSLFLQVNLSVVLARHYLAGQASGRFAVGMLVARAAKSAPRFVTVVAFPRFATARDRRILVRAALPAIGGVSLIVVVAAALGSRPLLGLLFGHAYVGLGSILWLFAGVGAAFAAVQLLLFAEMAAGETVMTRALMVSLGIQGVLVVVVFHASSAAIAGVVFAVAVGLLAFGLAWEFLRPRFRRAAD